MKVRISENAESQLNRIWDYIAKDSPDTASNVIASILDAISRLTDYPKSGRPARREGTRELVRPPYVIVYRIEEDVIDVLSIFHGNQRF